ncbi:MAG: phytanoyl-CoA dioxygenase family protein [Actinomycetota bacterium]
MLVEFGSRHVEWPGPELGELRDAPPDPSDRRIQLADDGYLLVRRLIEPPTVVRARARIAEALVAADMVDGTRTAELAIGSTPDPIELLGHRPVTHHPDVLAALESPALFELFSELFDEPATTLDFKWLRPVGTGELTGAHLDAVFMNRGSDRLLTTWIPLGTITPQDGSLAIVPSSHRSEEYQRVRSTYGQMDVDRDNVEGWLTDDPPTVTADFGGRWATSTFEPGDVLVFTMFTMHASTTNTTGRYRLSCDTRFQPAGDPIDERWMGSEPIGHLVHDEPATSIEHARHAWGINSR